MLTKNLLRFKTRKQEVVPEFVDLASPEILALAGDLLDIFKNAKGKSRAELEEETQLILNDQSPEGSIGRGFEKLLFDRLEFAKCGVSTSDTRNSIFSFASELLAKGDFANLDEYQSQIADRFRLNSAHLCEHLFDDLPMHQRAAAFKSLSVEALLHRYNCAQVQGHLLHCQSLKVKVPGKQIAELRRLLKYVRFFNLVAHISAPEKGSIEIVIDGPLSLFFQTQKYGMSLANFFPALLHVKNWEMEATVQLNPQSQKSLKVDSSCGMKSHYDHFSAFVPEEIKMFQGQFEKKVSEWKIAVAEEFLPFEGDAYCLPDFCFVHSTGKKVFLEVFHAWHGSPLGARLQQLEKPQNAGAHPLLLAAAKTLLKDEKISEAVESSRYFKNFGVVFREMPTVDQVLGLLKQC